VVLVTPRPGASLYERLRDGAENLALIVHALERIAEKDDERAQLSKTIAARVAELADELRADVGLLPRGRGRPLAKISPNFRQQVLRLQREEGWGRPRIAEAMRVSEAKVRRVLEEARDQAGEKPSARRGATRR
jgi:DNA-directed RNA polymerase specialized sigma24 family protein